MNTKCNCIPIEYPEEAEVSVIYMIPCKNCGYHLTIRKKGDYSQPKRVEMVPAESRLKLKFNYAESDKTLLKKFSSVLSVPKKLADFKKGTGLSQDESRNILYEMLADGDITEDQFNNKIFNV